MTKLTVAGIIATYDQEIFIEEAVNSLAGQVDELIVVDDFSGDRTFAVLQSMVGHENLRVLRNDRRMGVSASFNRAVFASTADIVVIQGGDDRSLPGRVELSRHLLDDPSVALVSGIPAVIDSQGRRLPDQLASEFLAGADQRDTLSTLLFDGNFICAPSTAMRRTDYLLLGGFRVGLDLLQDYALWLELAERGRFAVTDRPIVEYRKHGMNLSREYVGLNSLKRRRHAAELEFIIDRFLRLAQPVSLDILARHALIDFANFSARDPRDRVALIELAHPNKMIRRRGVARLFEIVGEVDGERHLSLLGLEMSDLSRLSADADHENLEAVERAMGVVGILGSAG